MTEALTPAQPGTGTTEANPLATREE